MSEIDNSQDMMDSRDIIARIEELEELEQAIEDAREALDDAEDADAGDAEAELDAACEAFDDDDKTELAALRALAEEAS